MRKLFTSILTLALVSSMSETAFASTINSATNTGEKSTSINVSGAFKTASDASQVIFVDITWDSMDFIYLSEGTWDPKTHSVSTTGTWRWSRATKYETSPKITVTNHSGTAVKANFSFNSGIEGLAGSFTGLTSDNALSLDSARGTTFAEAPTKSISFSITEGEIDEDYDTLGTITVNVAKENPAPSPSADSDVTP